MAQLSSLVVPIASIPKPDLSWMEGLASAGGDILGELGARKSFGGLADRIGGTAQPQQSGGFLSRLIGGGQQQAPMTAPVTPVQRGAPGNAQAMNYRDAIASIESKGSGDYAAVGPTHPKLGRALGRYQIMESNIGPWSQEVLGQAVTPEQFMASPELQDKIFDGKFQSYVSQYGPEGAAQAWLGGPGGVGKTDRKDSLGTSIGEYGQRFTAAVGGAPETAVDAVNGMADGSMATAYVDPMVNAAGSRAAPAAPQAAPTNQVADASGGIIAAGVTPVQRGGVDPETIQFMLRDPNLRETGVKLWAANVQGQKASEPWQFVNLPDGTLARANQQTGAVERLGNFAKPVTPDRQNLVNAGEGRLYDPNSGEWIVAPSNGQTGFRRATPEEAAQYGSAAGQFGPDGRFYANNPPQGTSLQVDPTTGAVTFNQGAGVKPLTEGQSKDTVYATRARGAMATLDPIDTALASPTDRVAGAVPVVGNYLTSEDYQKANNAGKEFLQAILRKDTGAAITKEETSEYGDVYLPKPGDSEAVISQKRQARTRALAAIEAGLPASAIIQQEKALTQRAGAPNAGTVEDGYRFKGGDPAAPNSWEKVN